MNNYAYVTALASANYLEGVRILLYCLRKVNSKYPLVVLIPETLFAAVEQTIVSWGGMPLAANEVSLGSLAEKNPRTYWNNTFFKLRIFDLTTYDKLVYIDSDMIVLENLDHLFERDHITAVQGGQLIFGWEDINSGLMVIQPSHEEYEALVALIPEVCERKIQNNASFGDQDVISHYYKYINHQWGPENRLDERYNAMIRCSHELCVHYGFQNLKVIHFTGEKKPWHFSLTEKIRYLIHYTLHHERYRARCALKYFVYVHKAKHTLKRLS